MTLASFWASVTAVVLTYGLAPIVLCCRALLRGRPVAGRAITPRVTVLIAARNEVAAIPAKLQNIAALDYPADLLEVIVVSDGSDDGTDKVVSNAPGAVQLISLPRVGKAAALNAGAARAAGDIFVFTDANSMLDPAAVQAIVRPFADPEVGGVAGDQRYIRRDADGANRGERGYWGLDRFFKRLESRAGSVVSATGSLYAVRRTLFEEIPAGVTDDFFTSTSVVRQGYRLVFCPSATAYEPPAATADAEFQRKVRVMSRGFRAVSVQRALLDPRRYGFYAIQLFWHKVLRRVMALPLVVGALASVALWRRGPLYRVAAACQLLGYGLGATGLVLRRRSVGSHPILAMPAYFCLVNAASLVALWNAVRGRQIDRWEPARTPVAPNDSTGAVR